MTGTINNASPPQQRPGALPSTAAELPYLSHFSLREEPFPAAPSAQHYFLTSASYQVLEGVKAALSSGVALMRIVGGDGIGKTMIARMVPTVLSGEMEPVFLDGASLPDGSFAAAVRAALGIPASGQPPLQQVLPFLDTVHQQQLKPVLVVDNAHLLGADALETIERLLTPGKPGAKTVPMQVLLLGSPRLETLIAASPFPHIGRRLGYAAELEPFTRQEATDYIAYRIRKSQVAGKAHPLFDEAGVTRLVAACNGNPRTLNATCEAALLIAYGDGADRVRRTHVDRAIEGPKPPSRAGVLFSGILGDHRLSWAAGGIGVVLGAGLTAAVLSFNPFADRLLTAGTGTPGAERAESVAPPTGSDSAPEAEAGTQVTAEATAESGDAGDAGKEVIVASPSDAPAGGADAGNAAAKADPVPVLTASKEDGPSPSQSPPLSKTVAPAKVPPEKKAVEPAGHRPETTPSRPLETAVAAKTAQPPATKPKGSADSATSGKAVTAKVAAVKEPASKTASVKEPVSRGATPKAATPPKLAAAASPKAGAPASPAPAGSSPAAPLKEQGVDSNGDGLSSARQQNGRWVWQ